MEQPLITEEELFWLSQNHSCMESDDVSVLIRTLRQIRYSKRFVTEKEIVTLYDNIDLAVCAAIRQKVEEL